MLYQRKDISESSLGSKQVVISCNWEWFKAYTDKYLLRLSWEVTTRQAAKTQLWLINLTEGKDVC